MAKERDYNIENYTDEEILDILGFRKNSVLRAEFSRQFFMI